MNNSVLSEDDYWDDIFSGVYDECAPLCLPIKYIDAVSITFKNGKELEIEIDKDNHSWDHVNDTMMEFIHKYERTIRTIGYNVDILQIKTDISKKTNKFLKKYNL